MPKYPAPSKPKKDGIRKISHLVIHCTGGVIKDAKGQHSDRYSTTAASIKAYHMLPEAQGGKGWADIGYNWVVEGSGAVKPGRDPAMIPAGVFGCNEDTVHICVTGHFDFDHMEKTHPQWRALVQTAATVAKRYGILPQNIITHSQAQALIGQPVTKSCPGHYLTILMDDLRDEVSRYL